MRVLGFRLLEEILQQRGACLSCSLMLPKAPLNVRIIVITILTTNPQYCSSYRPSKFLSQKMQGTDRVSLFFRKRLP